MSKVTLSDDGVPCGFKLENEQGRSVIFQTDYDFPPLASNLGAKDVVCGCGATDGTVDCPHFTASKMIELAGDWLHEHLDETFECDVYDEMFESEEEEQGMCDCQPCAVCKGERTVCAKCHMCTRCHEHIPGCPGCSGKL